MHVAFTLEQQGFVASNAEARRSEANGSEAALARRLLMNMV